MLKRKKLGCTLPQVGFRSLRLLSKKKVCNDSFFRRYREPDSSHLLEQVSISACDV